MNVPVYIVTGFLGAGKTRFITDMLTDEGFSEGEKTLLLCCEEGEEEYDPEALKKGNAVLVNLDDPKQIAGKRLMRMNREHQPERVIIEYNATWLLQTLYNAEKPDSWALAQIIDLVDASTFEMYLKNMRKYMADGLKEADLVIFNRCDENSRKSPWRRAVKGLNSGTRVFFENLDGTTDDGVADEDLPYDVKADPVTIGDEDFGTFYLDAMEHPERYDKKVIRAVGQPFPHARLSKGFYFFGRYAMTCCANDIQKAGWICKGSQTPSASAYIRLTARCEKATDPDGQTALILREISAESAPAPKDKYVTFMNI